jgi:hypothetical protein
MNESANGRVGESAIQRTVMCLILLLVLCASCAIPERPSFRLHILESRWYDLELGHEREQAWDILQEVDLKDSVVVITENDIERYDWEEQVITLTVTASDRLNKVFTDSEYPSTNLRNRVFIVTFDGNWLYGGAFIGEGSEMPVEYPVIYVRTSGGAVTFRVRPSHSTPAPYAELDQSYKSIIEIPELHDFFLEQGKLIEQPVHPCSLTHFDRRFPVNYLRLEVEGLFLTSSDAAIDTHALWSPCALTSRLRRSAG